MVPKSRGMIIPVRMFRDISFIASVARLDGKLCPGSHESLPLVNAGKGSPTILTQIPCGCDLQL
jgi:hypothetical protein